jgi:hypothetical protein
VKIWIARNMDSVFKAGKTYTSSRITMADSNFDPENT